MKLKHRGLLGIASHLPDHTSGISFPIESFEVGPTVGFHPKVPGEVISIVRTTTDIQKSRGPVGITSGRRSYKNFIFTLYKNGTGARHRGRIAPNRD